MRLNFTENYIGSDIILAFDLCVKGLHDIMMADECGIKHYKTDILHDIVRIVCDLHELRSKSDFTYKTVIGTRESGTYTADSKKIRDYWESSAIMGVGLEIIHSTGKGVTINIYTMQPSEIEDFIKEG